MRYQHYNLLADTHLDLLSQVIELGGRESVGKPNVIAWK
jgi:hypothetical protein